MTIIGTNITFIKQIIISIDHPKYLETKRISILS